jgi:hypothetical protein
MSFFGNLFGGNSSQQNQANQMSALLQAQAAAQAADQLKSSYGKAEGRYDKNYFDPYSQRGDVAGSMYSNALGLNGPSGNAAATSAFQAGPGFAAQMAGGVQALDRSAAGKGLFGSGNNAAALTTYGQGLANQEYGNWLQNLAGLNNQGFQAAAGQTGRQGNLANLDMGYGTSQANLAMDAAKNAADSFRNNANQDQQNRDRGTSNLWSALMGGANLGLRALAFKGTADK